MSFAAKYPGRCDACDERIHIGDEIKYSDDEIDIMHASCDVPSPPNPRDDLSKVCRSCFTIHSGECL